MATSIQPFSIQNFKKAFNNSKSRKYMSDMEIEQVRAAMEEKDVMLLGKLYEILLEEQANDEQIIRDFVMTKNRILDDFMAESKSIENKMLQAPLKKKVATTEKNEQKHAEALLKNLK